MNYQKGGGYSHWKKGAGLTGTGFDVYKGTYWQKGAGLGSTFKKFWSWIVPIFKKHALPKLQSGLEVLGNEGVSTVKNIYKDVVDGKNLKESAKNNINTAADNLKNKVESAIEGAGLEQEQLKPTINNKKRKKKIVHFNHKKKKVFQDIFS